MMAPDYNDGKWHGFNGGDIPVDRRSTVQVVWADDRNPEKPKEYPAHKINWRSIIGDAPVAFRVVKEYQAPREWWIPMFGEFPGPPCMTEADARDYHPDTHNIIHVREVTEGGDT